MTSHLYHGNAARSLLTFVPNIPARLAAKPTLDMVLHDRWGLHDTYSNLCATAISISALLD